MLLWDKGWTIYVTNFFLSIEGQIEVIDTKYVVLQKKFRYSEKATKI